MSTQSLTSLFSRIAEGDPIAFEKVFNRWYDAIFTTALAYGKSRELASDICQQVFLSVWERRELLQNVKDPEAWLHTAARYQALASIKKEMQTADYLRSSGPMGVDQITPEEKVVKMQQQQIIAEAVQQLPPKLLQIYQLSRVEGLTYAEIGGRMGYAHETIKDYMARALQTIRQKLLEQKNDLISLFFIFLQIFY